MIRKLICKRCLAVVGTKESFKSVIPKKTKLCDTCKSISLKLNLKVLLERNTGDKLRKLNSNRLKKENPMFSKEIKDKVSSTLKRRYKNGEITSAFSDPEKLRSIKSKWKITDNGRKILSDRMIINNPMSNDHSKRKMSSTFKRKILLGEILYKHGPDHHLWKGNRRFSDTCRTQLYKPWTFKILERDGFKCCSCKSTKGLQAHHIKPLRVFIEEGKREFQLKHLSDLDDATSWKLVEFIISKHKLEDGITVCGKCHSKIDKFYHENKKHK